MLLRSLFALLLLAAPAAAQRTAATGRPAAPDLLNGLAGYWEMESTSFLDSSGNGNTLTNGNSVTVSSPGRPGNYAAFTAASSMSLSKASPSFVPTGAWTAGCWVNFTAVNANQSVFAQTDSSSRGYDLNLTSGGSLRLTNRATAANTTISSPSAATWYFVVFGYDGTNTFYSVNGAAKTTSATSGFSINAADSLVFGGRASNYFGGSLDGCFQFSGVTLSDAQIAYLYNAGSGRSYVDLLSQRGGIVKPNSIVGLLEWLDAADPATLYQDSALTTLASANNDPVGGWKDKSGNANHVLQATAGARPLLKTNTLNGNPVVRWDGVNDYLQLAAFSSPPTVTTMLAVVKTADASSLQVFVDSVNPGDARHVIIATASNQIALNQGGSNITASGAFGTGYVLVTAVFAGTAASAAYINGGTAVSGDAGSNSLGGLSLGTNYAASGGWLNGDFAELVIYNRLLTTQEQIAVQSYLARRWGISAAVGRPYGARTPKRLRWAEAVEAFAAADATVAPGLRRQYLAGAN